MRVRWIFDSTDPRQISRISQAYDDVGLGTETTTVEGFEQEVKKQQESCAKCVEERDEATRQQEKWKKEIEAKLQQDIKRVREQQVAELRARKRQAK